MDPFNTGVIQDAEEDEDNWGMITLLRIDELPLAIMVAAPGVPSVVGNTMASGHTVEAKFSSSTEVFNLFLLDLACVLILFESSSKDAGFSLCTFLMCWRKLSLRLNALKQKLH